MRLYRVNDSQIIHDLGYNKIEQILYIRFKKNLELVYAYHGVPTHTLVELISAESTGSYFSRHIRSHYEFEKLPFAELKAELKLVSSHEKAN